MSGAVPTDGATLRADAVGQTGRVSAFAEREPTLAAYKHAVDERYRFYSYGDCMFVE